MNPPGNPCDTPGVICTVAGTGESAFNGDGHPALETALYFPLDVDFDRNGRPVILDFNNIRVRRLNEDGTIETVIGLDYEDIPVDGALAQETPLHHPSDIEYDREGTLYIAGDHVPLVLSVGIDNHVRILAGSDEFGNDGDGGPARAARMMTPFGIVLDGRGGFFVSDLDSNVVRHVDADEIITTVAGVGEAGYDGDGGPATEAKLNRPTRLRLTPDDELLICDTDNNVIRRVDSDGNISTIAGTGDGGYSGDGGPATAARFSRPHDLHYSPGGDLYVADTGNHVIRRIATDGVVTTVVGTPESDGFEGDGESASGCLLNAPSGLNFDADGSLWIADAYNHRVRRVMKFLSTVGS